MSEVCTLLKLILVIPATNAVSEQSASAVRRLKTYLRSTMLQLCLNNLMFLHVHKNRTDSLELDACLNKSYQEVNTDYLSLVNFNLHEILNVSLFWFLYTLQLTLYFTHCPVCITVCMSLGSTIMVLPFVLCNPVHIVHRQLIQFKKFNQLAQCIVLYWVFISRVHFCIYLYEKGNYTMHHMLWLLFNTSQSIWCIV